MDHLTGVYVDGLLCEANATSGSLKFNNNITAGNNPGKNTERNSSSTYNMSAWYGAGSNDSLTSSAGILVNPYDYLTPDYRPVAGSIALTNVFTFNSLGMNEVSLFEDVFLYPNPTNDEATLVLELNDNSTLDVVVYDLSGKVVSSVFSGEVNVGKTEFKIDANEFENGIYYTKISTGNSLKTIKMVVSK
jgi:hypothetical protein